MLVFLIDALRRGRGAGRQGQAWRSGRCCGWTTGSPRSRPRCCRCPATPTCRPRPVTWPPQLRKRWNVDFDDAERDRPPLPPPGRDRHAVLRHRRLRHPERPGRDGPGARLDAAGAGRHRPGRQLPGRAVAWSAEGVSRPAAAGSVHRDGQDGGGGGAAVPGGTDRFVGRLEELGRLAEACCDVRAGRGRVLVVSPAPRRRQDPAGRAGRGTGPAGRAADRLGPVLTGGGAPALWPWPPVLAQLCGPDTAALLAEDDAGSAVVDPERFARFVAVSGRLAAACAGTPTYLVLDDLHGAEPAAVLLTRFLARLRPRPALLLVVTARDGPRAADLAADLVGDAGPAARARSRRHPRLPRRAVPGGHRAGHRPAGRRRPTWISGCGGPGCGQDRARYPDRMHGLGLHQRVRPWPPWPATRRPAVRPAELLGQRRNLVPQRLHFRGPPGQFPAQRALRLPGVLDAVRHSDPVRSATPAGDRSSCRRGWMSRRRRPPFLHGSRAGVVIRMPS